MLFDLCINYSDFTLTSQTGANTADGHGLAKEFVVRLEGKFEIRLIPQANFRN